MNTTASAAPETPDELAAAYLTENPVAWMQALLVDLTLRVPPPKPRKHAIVLAEDGRLTISVADGDLWSSFAFNPGDEALSPFELATQISAQVPLARAEYLRREAEYLAEQAAAAGPAQPYATKVPPEKVGGALLPQDGKTCSICDAPDPKLKGWRIMPPPEESFWIFSCGAHGETGPWEPIAPAPAVPT